MIFEGDRDFPQNLSELWAKLRDARWLVHCIPDSTAAGTGSHDQAACTVRPGFSFVRGSLDVVLEVADAIEDKSLRFLVTSKGIGSKSDVETYLTFEPHDGGTRVHWKAEVKRLGGLLSAVPTGLIRGAAQKVIGDVWDAVTTRLADSS